MEQFVVWLELLICQFARCADSLVIANLGFAEWQALLLPIFGFGQDGWQRLLLIVDMVAPIWNLQELCRWRKVKPSPYVHQNKKRLVLHRLYSGRSTRQNIVLETSGGQGHCYLVSLVGGKWGQGEQLTLQAASVAPHWPSDHPCGFCRIDTFHDLVTFSTITAIVSALWSSFFLRNWARGGCLFLSSQIYRALLTHIISAWPESVS